MHRVRVHGDALLRVVTLRFAESTVKWLAVDASSTPVDVPSVVCRRRREKERSASSRNEPAHLARCDNLKRSGCCFSHPVDSLDCPHPSVPAPDPVHAVPYHPLSLNFARTCTSDWKNLACFVGFHRDVRGFGRASVELAQREHSRVLECGGVRGRRHVVSMLALEPDPEDFDWRRSRWARLELVFCLEHALQSASVHYWRDATLLVRDFYGSSHVTLATHYTHGLLIVKVDAWVGEKVDVQVAKQTGAHGQ